MCTFVFLKTAAGHLLGMNRDEGGLFYPRDPGSGSGATRREIPAG